MKTLTLIVITQWKKILSIVSFVTKHTKPIKKSNICNFIEKKQKMSISELLIRSNLKDSKNTTR